MRGFHLLIWFCLLTCSAYGQLEAALDFHKIKVIWKAGQPVGDVKIKNGIISKIEIEEGKGSVKERTFAFESTNDNSLAITFDSLFTEPGSLSTLVTVNSNVDPFSFFLRDVSSLYPIYIPEYEVVVLPFADKRSYNEIKKDILDRNLLSNVAKMEKAAETSFEEARQSTRKQSVPTWLGTSRDIRIFQISQSLETAPFERDVITPQNAHEPIFAPGEGQRVINYSYVFGRGQGVRSTIDRKLEDGVLPILNTQLLDGGIQYSTAMFTALERSILQVDQPYGTNFWVADHHLAGHMFTEEQQKVANGKLEAFHDMTNEQTVLFSKTIIKNVDPVPRYAWIKIPCPGRAWWDRFNYQFDQGYSQFSDDAVFLVAKLNDDPIPNEEMAILIHPNDSVIVEFFLPHSPISRSRAEALFDISFENKLREVKSFWNTKLDLAAKIQLPETRIDEMIRAGLLHLDLLTYGQEPEGPLAPSIGIYAPIGTESAPIMQFYMSIGLFDEARRALMYFLEKQHENGMIQNFGGYMVETGAVLWSIGEYIRYTRDLQWLRKIKPQLIRSCNFLLEWRNENKQPNLINKGYGF